MTAKLLQGPWQAVQEGPNGRPLEMTAWSKETMKAMTLPAITAGWMMGRITRRKTVLQPRSSPLG